MLKFFKEKEINNHEKGVILIFALLILSIILLLSSYFVSSSLSSSKISLSQVNSTRAYYLSEAGVEEAIFKLKNDADWKDAFETEPTPEDPDCSSWSIPGYEREPALFDNGSYKISIENLGCARAKIVSTAIITSGDKKIAQRIIKIEVFKAIEMDDTISEFGLFTGGSSENITISSTDSFNVYNGSIFSNNKIKLQFSSNVNVDKKALANNRIDISSVPNESYLNASALCSGNICEGDCPEGCPPEAIQIPQLDFNAYLQDAKDNDCGLVRTDGESNCYFSSSEKFEKMLWENYPEITLNGVIYVDGDVDIRAGQDMIINGTLVSGENKNINIGKEKTWSRSEPPYTRSGRCNIEINRQGEDDPSGILAQKRINIGEWLGVETEIIYIEGLIYGGYETRIINIGAPIEIYGGVAASKFTMSSMWNQVDIYLDSDIIVDTFRIAQYSPIISISHWEEEY